MIVCDPQACSRVDQALERCLNGRPGPRRLVVAHSGGPDSLTLLWALHRLEGRYGLQLWAVHVDHGLDAEAGARAHLARHQAEALDVPWILHRLAPERRPPAGASVEAWARRERYAVLATTRQACNATAVLTAHHADDQAETVLLRLLAGSGWAGLAGMEPDPGPLWRPFLHLSRRDLEAARGHLALPVARDPANRDRRFPRARLRHDILPAATAGDPELIPSLLRLADRARHLRRGLRRRFADVLDLRREWVGASAAAELLAWPPEPMLWALGELHRRAGAGAAPRGRAVEQLRRQVRATGGVRHCDAGGGWSWTCLGDRLWLCPRVPQPFHYNFRGPGGTGLPLIGRTLRLRRGAVENWMFRGDRRRAGLAVPATRGVDVVVRSRRAGDRIHPLGAPGSRLVKDLLIDRRIPRPLRAYLPLLEIAGRLAWIPGVAIDESFRIRDRSARVWIAELDEGMPDRAALL